MLNIDLIRKEPDTVRRSLTTRGEDTAVVDEVLKLDTRRRQLVTERDQMRGKQNEVNRRLGQQMATIRKQGGAAEPPKELREELDLISKQIESLNEESNQVEASLQRVMLTIPNIPLPDVPVGADSDGNIVASTWGQPKHFDFKPLPHWDLNEKLDILDMERGVKLSGARFFVMKGKGARLQRALINWMLDVHTAEYGYRETRLPYLVKEETLVGSGNLPKFGDNLYRDAEEDLWLIPTAEVGLTSLHRDEILEPGVLPLRYVAYTPCFRREKTSAGKDTRGIKRVHQFDKVELYSFVEPSKSEEAFQNIVKCSESLIQRLGIPYRVLRICTSDMGFQSAQTYDLEMWAPGCEEWLEVSSCSTCTDFQARRANIRYRPTLGARPEYPHTLNGSALALPRVVIAILETYQQADGSVVIPEVLRPYTGFDRIEPVKK
ncbi:MAG: serine--tRNA ligase [Dehalococcoidia bacterium]|nr:serine--tRNA ligase [Dehalococcoidia bacterium]